MHLSHHIPSNSRESHLIVKIAAIVQTIRAIVPQNLCEHSKPTTSHPSAVQTPAHTPAHTRARSVPIAYSIIVFRSVLSVSLASSARLSGYTKPILFITFTVLYVVKQKKNQTVDYCGAYQQLICAQRLSIYHDSVPFTGEQVHVQEETIALAMFNHMLAGDGRSADRPILQFGNA